MLSFYKYFTSTQKNINFDNINGNLYDLIILGGVDVVHSGLPTASQIHNFIPRLYSFLDTQKLLYIRNLLWNATIIPFILPKTS